MGTAATGGFVAGATGNLGVAVASNMVTEAADQVISKGSIDAEGAIEIVKTGAVTYGSGKLFNAVFVKPTPGSKASDLAEKMEPIVNKIINPSSKLSIYTQTGETAYAHTSKLIGNATASISGSFVVTFWPSSPKKPTPVIIVGPLEYGGIVPEEK